jgi:hypothetical protein
MGAERGGLLMNNPRVGDKVKFVAGSDFGLSDEEYREYRAGKKGRILRLVNNKISAVLWNDGEEETVYNDDLQLDVIEPIHIGELWNSENAGGKFRFKWVPNAGGF